MRFEKLEEATNERDRLELETGRAYEILSEVGFHWVHPSTERTIARHIVDSVQGTIHVLKRQKPRGGNNFYRDRSERKAETFCGATLPTSSGSLVTDQDPLDSLVSAVPWNAQAEPWTDVHGINFRPCPTCKEKRDEFRVWWKTKKAR